MYRIGIDVGGTFTDLVLARPDGSIVLEKSPTTPQDQSIGVVTGIERLAERIYEMSVDTFSQTVMPSLHAAGWQRRHLDWEFKLADQESEPDRTLVDGIINATESFLRSSEVHRLFIQELVQGTFCTPGQAMAVRAFPRMSARW